MAVKVFIKADFVADFNAVDVDPGFGYVRLDFALEVGVDAVFEGYAFAIAQVAGGLKGEVLVRGVCGVVAEIGQLGWGAVELGEQAIKLGALELEAAFDDFLGAGVVPANGAQDGAVFASAEPDFASFERLGNALLEGVKVSEYFVADLGHQGGGGGEQVGVFRPGGGAEELGAVFGAEGDLVSFAPAQDAWFVLLEYARCVNVVAPLLVRPRHGLFEDFIEAQAGDALGAELGATAVGAFDADFVVAKVGVVEDLRGDAVGACWALVLAAGEVSLGDLLYVLGGKFTILLAEVFAQLAKELAGFDELHFAAALSGLVIREHPDVGGDAGVIEQVVGQLDDGLKHVVLDDVAADVAFTAASVASEEAGAVMDGGDARADAVGACGFHFADHLHEEE